MNIDQKEQIAAARAAYVAAATECWKAWRAYAALGAYEPTEMPAYSRFFLPGVEGRMMPNGSMFDMEAKPGSAANPGMA